jgi:ferredoxin
MNIVLDRENCSVCGTCWETCPAIFEQNLDDSFSQIVEKYRVNKDNAVGKPPAESGECSAKAADLCCAEVIHIEAD